MFYRDIIKKITIHKLNNLFLDKKTAIISVLALVVLAVLVVFAFQYKLKSNPSTYSVSGSFIKMTVAKGSPPVLGVEFMLDSGVGVTTDNVVNYIKKGIITKETLFYALRKNEDGTFTKETYRYALLKAGDKVVVSSSQNIQESKSFNIKEFYVYK